MRKLFVVLIIAAVLALTLQVSLLAKIGGRPKLTARDQDSQKDTLAIVGSSLQRLTVLFAAWPIAGIS